MPKSKAHNRRTIITIIVMATVALVGLAMSNIDQAQADKVLPAGPSEGPSTPDLSDQAEASAAVSPEGSPSADPSVMTAIAKMVSALVLVILLVYGALYALRRMMGRRYGSRATNDSLQVLQTTYVGQHKAISLVKVGQRSVLVGVTDNQISTLTELDAAETEQIVDASAQPTRSESFSRLLLAATEKLKVIGLNKKQAALET